MARRKHSKKRGSQRRKYRHMKHGKRRLTKRRRRMNVGQASRYCSIKNGYTSKKARRDCMGRRMKGHFAGRRLHHRRKSR